MHTKIATAIVLATLALSGCATEYNPKMGTTGGAEVSMITPTRAIVSFSGNGFTSGDKVQQYVMLRAAELAYEKGYSHFAILGAEDASTSSAIYSSYGTGWYDGGNAYGGVFGAAAPIEFPKTRLTIELRMGNPTGDPNIFSAAEIINTIRPTL